MKNTTYRRYANASKMRAFGTLSRRLCAVALITAIALFASCKEPEEENTTITDNTIGTGMTVIYSAKYLSTKIDDAKNASNFGYFWDWDGTNHIEIASPISTFLNGSPSVTVKDEKVDIILGTPKSSYMMDISDLGPTGITRAPSNAKFYMGQHEILFFLTSDLKYGLFCLKGDNNFASLIFVDKDVTINGTYTHPADSSVMIWNCALKQGWNYLILENLSATLTNITASTKKPEGYEWTVVDYDSFF